MYVSTVNTCQYRINVLTNTCQKVFKNSMHFDSENLEILGEVFKFIPGTF